ncbi:MAG: metal ABC transporter ATP-binding protein [Clostridiales bacterium]|nr:metal ABC transporter ATP-binding protein [Clostridiales bacterium]
MKQIESAVSVTDLTVAYDAKPVLWDVDLELPRGLVTAVIGPNGAGKSTLLKAMLGLLKPVSGQVAFPCIAGSVKNQIAYVPQSESVDWDFPATVLDVVMMGRYGHLGWLRRPGKEEKRLSLEVLEQVGMQSYASRQISQLSGGQQQRVFLARALVQQAQVYLMDEPFKGVDAQTEKSIITLLRQLKEAGKTVIVVHHDLQTVTEYFDWAVLINKRVVANGPVDEVFHEENLGLTYRASGSLLKEAI